MTKDFDLLHVQIVGFIGQHHFRNPAVIAEELRSQLKKMESPGKRLLALSPLSGTADLLFAREVLALNIPLVIALTQPREEMKKKFSEGDAIEFDDVLRKATRVESLLLALESDTTTRLGQKLADEADVILAVAEANGADQDCSTEVIAYATRRGRPVICLWEGDGGITVREIRSDSMQEKQLSVEQLQALLGEASPEPKIPEQLLKYFHACDGHASNAAPSIRAYYLNIVLATAVAATASSVSSSFDHQPIWGIVLTSIRFLCIGASLWIGVALHRRQSRDKWLNLRLRAEISRSAIATWNLPTPIEPITAEEAPELRPLLQALRYYRATKHHATEPLEAFKAAYGKRLIDQYNYYTKQSESAISLSAWIPKLYLVFNVVALVASVIAIPIGLSYFANWRHLHRFWDFLIVFIPIAAPQIGAWIMARYAIEAASRKQVRFVDMRKAMHQALVDLVHCHSWDTVQHVVKKAEKHLLTEVLEWHSFIKYSK
jgi:hypothetical protein